ncbi:asparagine synthase (glutamine-hydrolysing) [Sulfurimonas denitrificans DSM 1251]|uniref:asparagine synthase (glutamine-hydrolyzing) n=1 Tax=Sulfurimonas denitrificans (strain ATCC 33889 / DSM 1251) TaxID=326298 RepID=Q30U64_SULDN|nr:asparagine synthase (glutamine-hydrolyzing) [Sulfurimonas denitrificans]ABB43467.1 asparagine synthase (glutamine-hydrolysing) [Sulfurimonas denitrificans DSM 1251]MDD3442939.1 asparagine synthase (glutamine-hydrolyzing) [Sulfurimonas denitrificans]
MCGIIGSTEINFNHNEVLNSLKHRGEDYQNYIIQNEMFFAHTRLSIIDLDEEANQPMIFDEITLVFNGEIYNYKELIKEFSLECVTKSDSEVLIRLYQKFGFDFLNSLEGMFAFCIYDKEKNLFFCARDRFGKKPLYYYCEKGKFYFASEIKAILKMLKTTPKLNEEALWQYLALQSPQGENTFYSGVKKLPASSYLLHQNSDIKVSTYYSLADIKITHYDEKQILKDVEKLLNDAVQKRLVGDVEVATLLSGGLDSSFITALYAKKSKHKVHTFSIGYDEHKHYCELGFAKAASEYIGTIHHEYKISKDEYLEAIEKVLEHLDEPMADSACIPTYILSKEIHNQGFKVCLSGEGSDESFLGYDNYFKMLNYYHLKNPQKTPFDLTKEWEYNNRRLNNQQVYQSSGETFTYAQLQRLFSKKIAPILHPYVSTYPPEQWLTYIDFSIWIAEVLMTKVDRMSMAHSLELRAPFLDHHLVEYLLGVESSIKIGDTNKAILKKIARNYLPNSIIDRRKKGFSSPFIEWLYDAHSEEILNLLLDVNKQLGIFNDDFLTFLYEEGKRGHFKQHVYSLYIFCRWYKKVYM